MSLGNSIRGSKPTQRRSCPLWVAILILVFVAQGVSRGLRAFETEAAKGKNPVTVADAIQMRRLANSAYFKGLSAEGRVAKFSPNGMRFAVVVRYASLTDNTNAFSVYVFESANVLDAKRREPDLTMFSSSNRDGVHDLKWLGDNETLAFVGENPNEPAQVYTFNIRTRRLQNRTEHATAVTNYDISRDGRTILFSAETQQDGRKHLESPTMIAPGQSLPEVLSGENFQRFERRLFLRKEDAPSLEIPVRDELLDSSPITLSPDGRYALVGAYVEDDLPRRDVRDHQYTSSLMESNCKNREAPFLNLKRYWLLDTTSGNLVRALDAPMSTFPAAAWSSDGASVFFKNIGLPQTRKTPPAAKARRGNSSAIEVKIPSMERRIVRDERWPTSSGEAEKVRVDLDEGINSPPRIYASRLGAPGKAMILDLNPQFSDLELGNVESIQWTVQGVVVSGGLYFPPHYRKGARYPLVIQTHGYYPERFSMDGLNEWSSGYAARPLAARGFLVLQAYRFKDAADHERIGANRSLGRTEEESFKRFNALTYDAAVNHLDKLGLIDSGSIGISGFSRTVCFVAYTLTHTKHKFAAVVLTDGIDCGYFNYVSFPCESWDADLLNGGMSPFGRVGMRVWSKESPGFHLERIESPVRLVALGLDSVPEQWEWFVGLTLQGKPVDFLELPGAVHLVQRPSDRRIAEEGIVDWFCFWLKGEEDPDAGKAWQYERWRTLRTNRGVPTASSDRK